MQNRHFPKQKPQETNEWLDDGIDREEETFPLAIPGTLLDCQKYTAKQQKTSTVQKTQRIKKPKKQERKASNREEHVPKTQIHSIEDRLVSESVNRLRINHSSSQEEKLPIYKRLTRQRLIDFLQVIEQEYTQTVKYYLASNINQQSCGNLKGLFLRFIDQIVDAFPFLNNIVFQYAFRYYATGPLQHRFSKLMDKNITPILKLMSEKYNTLQRRDVDYKDSDFETSSTHVSHSPEREHLEEFEEQDAKKTEKKRKKRNKKKEDQKQEQEGKAETTQKDKKQTQAKSVKEQPDLALLELNNFLENLKIDRDSRAECRVQESYILKWRTPTPTPIPRTHCWQDPSKRK